MTGIKTISILLFATLIVSNIYGQTSRDEIDDKYKWELGDLYKTEQDWGTEKEKINKELSKIESFKGKLLQSPANLVSCLEFISKIRKEATKLYMYAGMHSDLDTRDMKYSGMEKELQQLFADFSSMTAYIDPEILKSDWKKIEQFISEEPRLKVYKKSLKDLFRQHKHTLSEPEEKILALSNLVTGSPGAVYSTFKNAEMPNPEVVLSNGEKVSLSSAGYGKHRASANRKDRELVFKAFWENYAKYQATFGEMLYGEVKSKLYLFKARKYKSSLEAALSPNNIPVEVYHALIENVNKNLDAFHRYLDIKRRMMKLDTLKYSDLYAPAVKGVDLKFSYEEAQNLILESLKPLGDDYVSTVKKAFSNRWLDVYPTKSKRSGAYSNGSDYDGHPFILLNYNDLYEDVSTTTHELGHTMHSYLSNKKQPYPLANYPIFVAEVASTFNEVLLFDYVMKKVKKDDEKLSLLMDRLNGFKGTLFRQTQFAEFELKIHELAGEGKPLTGKVFSDIYMDIVKRYYGHDKGICVVEDFINMEWAYIPHFYYNFYVYQYSTSFTASNSLAQGVLNKEKGALDNYLAFLSSGGSDYPIELLKKAGIDMTSPEVFNKTIDAMNKVMDEIEKILKEKGM